MLVVPLLYDVHYTRERKLFQFSEQIDGLSSRHDSCGVDEMNSSCSETWMTAPKNYDV